MPQAISQTAPTRHRLTVDEYHRMGEAGILQQDSRIELLDGELIDIAPISSLHAAAVNDVTEQFIRKKPADVIVSIQNPILLDNYSEPQPDIMILRPHSDRYRSALPTAEDVLLLVEIADSSLNYDRNRKIPLYARNGVPEVWILDLSENILERYRDPDRQAESYRSIDRQQHGKIRPQQLAEPELDLDLIW